MEGVRKDKPIHNKVFFKKSKDYWIPDSRKNHS